MSDSSDLATNIHRLSTVLGRVADSTLQDCCGFGTSQFKILWMLKMHQEGVLQTTIASWLSQTEAAVSRQIGLLAEEGLIDKQIDPNNRRNHIIMLSIKGKKFAGNAMDALVKEYKPYFDILSKTEQGELNKMLEKIFFAVVTLLDLRKIPAVPESPEEYISSVSDVKVALATPPSDNESSASLLVDPGDSEVLRKPSQLHKEGK